MKTYDSERKELFDWLSHELTKLEHEWQKKYIKDGTFMGGQDTEEEGRRHLIISEYNRKVLELRRKYGR